ncbi:MAG: M23 family metallopeptidase [Spirochaetaceae bacterium]|jgi:murein DD-endopeptidase MepM/ murein hydrolase activator NlpD|nr:M23 family metallopeptidase [Spirochaetaceae bacterium]
MARIHGYKRLENNLVKGIKRGFLGVLNMVLAFFKKVGTVLWRRYTIVLVPHSEKKVYNLQMNFLTICLVALVISGMIASFFWYETSYGKHQQDLNSKDSRLRETQASLDQLRDELSILWREAHAFQATLSGVFSSLGLNAAADPSKTAGSGDFSSFFDMRETAEGRLREADDVRSFANYLIGVVEPLKEMGMLLDAQSSLLTEVPNMWPIKGGMGHISMFFGENEDPFTGQIYVHKGIDLSTYRQGDPIVATADGQVVTVDYDASGFGNYVIIRHKHGFYTRYGHMLSFKVRTGQRVQQGEVIGYIGNTGRSTGPHVHYEVHIGSDVVDPYKFLNIRSINGRLNLNGGKS